LGGNHSLILTDANKVYSFGYNYYGGLGLGDTTDRNVPTEITTSLDGNPIQV
jgi:alpha-tubulin suppressor-like RCC1 family protein